MEASLALLERLQTIMSSGWGFSALEALIIAELCRRIWNLWEARLADKVKDSEQSTGVFKEVGAALRDIASKTERDRPRR